ncbi:hypothetical protein [Marinicella meishanensis]|uniref:hypothetical protein n=1 Tax=Marinicella meishanensis TaxID=2873263 RepID=UPI001CBB0517|nr:hypothetical protein [Marinicella sp. NBU2979]
MLNQFFDFRLVNAMIVMHVILGSLAFIVGAPALLAKKGSPLHVISGQIFFWLMTYSAAFTLVVSVMPFHISPSMFQISVMTLYFLIGGVRSLSYRNGNHSLMVDKGMVYMLIVVSVYLFLHPVFVYGELSPLRTVFGAVALLFGLIDLWIFHQPEKLKRFWLFSHLAKMLAGYATAVTGFFVAQDILGGYYNWFTPTVICLAYIYFWALKLKVFQGKTQSPAKKHTVSY